MEYLGLDMWMQILSGLSVKDLIRLKCVSKTFLDLISSLICNDDFIRLHLNKSSLRAIHLYRCNYLRLKQHGEAESSLRAIHINKHTYLDCVMQKGGEVDEIATKYYGSCNGLVCLLTRNDNNKYGGGVLLWNPALHEVEYVPIKRPPIKTIRCSWFGYDNDEYKLVLGTDSHIHLIRLYTDTDSWKSSLGIDKLYDHCDFMGTLVHRTVHWPTYYKWDHKFTIMSYDLSSETVGWIASPCEMTREMTDHWVPFILGQVDGCLSTMFDRHHYHSEVWVMKEYGVQESWTMLMILRPHIARSIHCCSAIERYQLTYPMYIKNFYVESLISPRSIKTKMS